MRTRNKITNHLFGTAVLALNLGKMVSREGWAGQNLYAFRQVPSWVQKKFIKDMSSLPHDVKVLLEERNEPLFYANQLALLHPDNMITGWVPSVSDVLALDWTIWDVAHIDELIGSPSEPLPAVEAVASNIGVGKDLLS